eukprot:SAG11_NODE_32991_length_279_cov_1.661111_1_plen_41_part_10
MVVLVHVPLGWQAERSLDRGATAAAAAAEALSDRSAAQVER